MNPYPKHTSKIPNFNLNLADMFLFIKMPGGKLCHLANISSAKIGQFGVPYFHKFATDVLETTQIELIWHEKSSSDAQYCLNEKTRKA